MLVTADVDDDKAIPEHLWDGLGGQTFRLWGDDGVYYYGAHLSAHGVAGRVAPGTVIGYVGAEQDAV